MTSSGSVAPAEPEGGERDRGGGGDGRPGRGGRAKARLPRPAAVRTPDRVAGGAFFLFMLPICVRLPWRGDIGHHAATVDRLRVDLLHPGNPLLDVPGSSPYYSPYTVAAALLARASGTTGLEVLSVCALVNVALLVTGVWAFTRLFSRHRWAPVYALAASVTLWGTELFLWGGLFPLMSLAVAVSYPSFFALAVTLHLWALAGWAAGRRAGAASREAPGAGARPSFGGQAAAAGTAHVPGRTPGPGAFAALGVLAALVLISHPITGVAAVMGVAALLADRPARTEALRRWRLWALAGGVALTVTVLWPYYNVLTLAGSDSLDHFHDRMYDGFLTKYGLALIGLPALAVRLRRDRLDPLVLMFGLASAAVLYGWVSGHYTWGRLLSVAVLAAQCALAVELAAAGPWRLPRRVLAGAAAAGAATGLWIQAGTVRYVLPEGELAAAAERHLDTRPSWPRYDWVTPHVRYGDVVLAASYLPTHMLPAFGVYTVAPAYPTPPVTPAEAHRRWADTRAFLGPATPGEQRAAVLRRYHVSWLLLSWWERTPQADAHARYELVARSARGERLLRVRF